jgi:ech hydrogenase subunit C
MSNHFKKSPWIIHYDASSCNGCDIETLACLTPGFDVERLGVVNTGNPKHADIFLVTGAVNAQCESVIRNIYQQMPDPKVVIAVGTCACSGGIFRECYNIRGGVDTTIPVDVYVPGCAARPEAIIDGVVKALGVLEEKQKRMQHDAKHIDQTLIVRAEKADAPEILALQKVSYQSEAEIYGDQSLPALQQTLEELQADFDKKVFLKAVLNGKIIGSVRAYEEEGTAFISRVVVHPFFRHRGIGHRLLDEVEHLFAGCIRFEVFTGAQSKLNIAQFTKRGYETFKTEVFSPAVTWVYMRRDAHVAPSAPPTPAAPQTVGANA